MSTVISDKPPDGDGGGDVGVELDTGDSPGLQSLSRFIDVHIPLLHFSGKLLVDAGCLHICCEKIRP